MTDYEGNELHVGDCVVYIAKTYCSGGLASGVISGFKKCFGKECAIIYNGWTKDMPTSRSIYLKKKTK